MPTTRAGILSFMREHSLAVQASVSASSSPQAAVIGFIVTDDFEMFFDTIDSTRKISNLRLNPRVAFVIGGLTDGDERTVQYEGVADEPKGVELEPGLTFVRARPRWLRFSNFNQTPPDIVELTFGEADRVGRTPA